MKKLQMPDGISRAFHNVGFKIKKHSPELLIAGGIIGGVTAAVMACKATLKVDEVTEEHYAKIDRIHEAADNGVTAAGEEYTAEDAKKDTTIVYVQTGVEFAKLYAPAVVLGAVSITAILAGHNIMNKRNAALAAACTAVENSFKEYRGRVVDRFGESLDRELKYCIQTKEYEEITVNEDGSESVEKKQVEVMTSVCSPFAVFFDEACIGWTKDPEYNKVFLIDQQRYLTDRLRRNGTVTLNEAYDAIGVPRTKAGFVWVWKYRPERPAEENYVDLGIFDGNREKNRDFVNGYERSILLDPKGLVNICEEK